MKIRMRNPEFPLYFIGELGFGIFLFLDSPYKVISLKEKCIMILICVTIWNIVFMISRMRIIIMDKNGCTVKLLLWKKTYKWEDLEIIREDCWNSGRLHLKGIVFSSRRMGKNGKVYSTKKIFQSLQFLNCFFIIFDDEDVERIYALKKKLGKVPEFKKTSENILTQLKDWGVKVEKGENGWHSPPTVLFVPIFKKKEVKNYEIQNNYINWSCRKYSGSVFWRLG